MANPPPEGVPDAGLKAPGHPANQDKSPRQDQLQKPLDILGAEVSWVLRTYPKL